MAKTKKNYSFILLKDFYFDLLKSINLICVVFENYNFGSLFILL